MEGMLPPVIFTIRANATEFMARMKEVRGSMGDVALSGDLAAANVQAAVAKQTAAQARLAAATTGTADKIKLSVDKQIAAERELAIATNTTYNERARRAQLTTAAIKTASAEQIAAERAVASAAAETAAAEQAAATRTEEAAARRRKAISKYSGAIVAGTTIAAAAVAYESVKMATDFQKANTRLVTAAGESEGAIKGVSNGILSVATATGTKVKELESGMYMIESAGYHGAAGLQVLKSAAQGAKIEGADLSSVGNALTTVMNDLGAKSGDSARLMSQMVTAVGQGKMTMDDLAGSIHSVLPNAAALKISFAETAGALATMTAQGMSADQSAQNLNHAIVKLAAPTVGMTQAMASYGLNAADVSKQLGKKGLTGTLSELTKAVFDHMGPAGTTLRSAFNESQAAAEDANRAMTKLSPAAQGLAKQFVGGKVGIKDFTVEAKKLPGLQGNLLLQWLAMEKNAKGFSTALKGGGQDAQTFTAAMKSMLGDQTGLQVALHLTGENMAGFKGRVKAIGSASADSKGNVKDWSVVQKNLATQLAQTAAIAETLGIKIGTKLIPVVQSLLKHVAATVNWFSKHKDVAIALGIVVGGVLTAAFVAWAVSLFTAGGALAFLMSPITAIIAGIGLLVFGIIEAYKHWAPFRDAVQTVGRVLKAVWDGVIKPVFGFITHHWGLVLAAVTGGLSLIAQHWRGIWTGIQAVYNAVIKPVFDFITDHWRGLLGILLPGFGLIRKHWESIWHAIQVAIRVAWNDVIKPVFNAIYNFGIKPQIAAVQMLFRFWRASFDAIRGVVSGAWNSVIKPVLGFIDRYGIGPLKSAIQIFGDVWGKIWHGVQAVVHDVWGVIKPIVDMIKRAIDDTVGAVGKVVGTVGKIGGKIGGFLGLDTGGPVPGAVGAPMAAIVHGGEYMLSHGMLTGSAPIDPDVAGAVMANVSRDKSAASALAAGANYNGGAPGGGGGGVAVAGPGGQPMMVTVQGSIIDLQGFFKAVQTAQQRNGQRNPGSGLPAFGRT